MCLCRHQTQLSTWSSLFLLFFGSDHLWKDSELRIVMKEEWILGGAASAKEIIKFFLCWHGPINSFDALFVIPVLTDYTHEHDHIATVVIRLAKQREGGGGRSLVVWISWCMEWCGTVYLIAPAVQSIKVVVILIVAVIIHLLVRFRGGRRQGTTAPGFGSATIASKMPLVE